MKPSGNRSSSAKRSVSVNSARGNQARDDRDPSLTPTDPGVSHSRRRRTLSETRTQGTVTFSIGSPESGDKSRSPFRPGSPYEGIPAAPAVDCSTGQLRDYTMAFFAHLNSKVMELQRQLAQDHGQFAKLNLEVDRTLDKLKLFENKVNGETIDKLKLFENKVNGDVNDSMVRSQVAMSKAEEVEAEMKELKTKLETVIIDFNGHVGGNFSIVEEEFQKLKQNLHAVGTFATINSASAARGSNEGGGNLARDVQSLATIVTGYGSDNQVMKMTVDGLRLAVNGLIGELGPDGCHCKHVDVLKKEMDETTNKLNALNIPMLDSRIGALEQAVRALVQQVQTSGRPLGASTFTGSGEAPPFIQAGRWTGPAGQGGDHPEFRASTNAQPVGPAFGPPGFGGGEGSGPGVNLNRLFDDKVALATEYSFDGGDEGDKWYVRTRGYWISKCPDILPMLNWAESFGNEKITTEIIQGMQFQQGWMTELNPERLGHVVWGFLNTCLKDKARTFFQAADELNGWDGWRRVVMHIRRSRQVRLGTLRKKVRNPPPITKLEDVTIGITKYDNLLRDFEAAGGTPPDDMERKQDLLDTLPEAIRENLLWRASRVDEKYPAFVAHVNETVDSILYHRGKFGKTVNLVDQSEDQLEDAICAMMKRFGIKGKDKGGEGAGRTGGLAQTQVERKMKCANCGSEQHDKSKCPKPLVPVGDRTCHGCGEKGHISRFCPHKGGRKAAGVVADGEDVENECMCLSQPGDWSTIPVGNRRPQPRQATLGDFVAKHAPETRTRKPKRLLGAADEAHSPKLQNKFEALAADESGNERSEMPGATWASALTRIPPKIPEAMINVKDPKQKSKQCKLKESDDGNNEHDYEPNELHPLEYVEPDDDDMIANVEEKKEISVAMDSGCVAHTVTPGHVPDTVGIDRSGENRNFVGAGGGSIANHGKIEITLEQDDLADVDSTACVADVCRALHSVSTTCDTGKEVLFTRGMCSVVPEGALSKFLSQVKTHAKYPRKGGLYVAKMRIKARKAKDPKNRPKAGFGRQGQKA